MSVSKPIRLDNMLHKEQEDEQQTEMDGQEEGGGGKDSVWSGDADESGDSRMAEDNIHGWGGRPFYLYCTSGRVT